MAGTPAQKGYNAAGNTDSSRKTVALASWPTPKASDGDKGVRTMRGAQKELERKGPGADLPTLAAAASLARLTASGDLLTGSDALMGSGGPLNPEHPRWLMGLPAVWGRCAPTAMRSTPNKRASSSNA